MYSQDYDGTWAAQAVDGALVAGAGGTPFNYKDSILPYTKNEDIWLCPSNIPNGALTKRPPYVGYHANGNVFIATGLAEAAMAAPANLLVVRESGKGLVFDRCYLRPYFNNCDDVINYENGSPNNYMPHMKGYNILLADGHAKWYKSGQTLTLSMSPADTSTTTQTLHPGWTLCPP